MVMVLEMVKGRATAADPNTSVVPDLEPQIQKSEG
jgi:hypothetical protein